MRIFLLIGLILHCVAAIGAHLNVVAGEFRLLLPKRYSSAQVTFELKEISAGYSAYTLAVQADEYTNGEQKTFALKYSPRANAKEKQYSVDIKVRETAGNKILAEASFPLESLDQPDKLNILIQVPADPIE